jgi:hypothetical protein
MIDGVSATPGNTNAVAVQMSETNLLALKS